MTMTGIPAAKRSRGAFFSKLICFGLIALASHPQFAHAKTRPQPKPSAWKRFQVQHGFRSIAAKEGPHETKDIRDLAPPRPEEMPLGFKVVPPQSGSDLGSVGADWMQRQTSFLLDGADQRFLVSLNKKMNRMLQFEPVEGEPWPEPQDETKGEGSTGVSDDEDDADKPSDYFGFRPTSIRILQANRVEFGLANRAQLNCAFTGDSVQFDLIHSLTNSIGLDLRHKSKRGESTLHLNYNW